MRNNTKLMDAAAVGGYSTATGHDLLMGYGALDAFTLLEGIGQARISATSETTELANLSMTDLGTAYVSQTIDFRVRIRNQGTSTLNLTSLTPVGTDYSISEAPGDTSLALGESTSFVLRVIPTATGLRTGSVSIGSNDSSIASLLLDFKVNAVAPDAAGYVFEDRNGNGTRETGENPLDNHFVFADANANNLFDLTSAPPAVGGSFPIADAAPSTGTQIVNGLGQFVNDINVTLNITHTYVSDLAIFLVAPTGQEVLLFSQRGGNGDNLVNTVFDDSAATAIGHPANVAPFTGSFQPEVPLSLFAGQPGTNLNGTWTLEVFDLVAGDIGTVNNWTLTIVTSEASDFTDSLGFYAFDGLANGSYSARYAQTGWSPSTVASRPFTITGPTSTHTGLNFGAGRNNRFYAHVFNDLDADGIVDGGEGPRAGRKIFIDSNNNGVNDTSKNFAAAPGTPLPNNTTVNVPVVVSGITANITDIDLTINMTHTWVEDMTLTLIAPGGAQAVFFMEHGGEGDNLTNTVFDDEAGNSISDGSAPFTGSFRPFEEFSIFDGLTPAQANGTWTIRMTDIASPDPGVLVSYDLKIDNHSKSNFAAAPGTPLPDLTTVNVPVVVSGITGSIRDIDLAITMTHTWVEDMELTLIAPNGTQARFFDKHGGSFDNLTNTVFDDEAATSISDGSAPFTGSFRPFEAFTIFDGFTPAQANGTWTIRMTDIASPDTGVLVNYDLRIEHSEIYLVTDADGWVSFDLPPGVNNMKLAAASGWNFTIPVNGLRTETVAGAPMFNRTYGERIPPSTTLVSRNVFYKGGTIPGAPASLFPTNKVLAKQGSTPTALTYANVINHTRGINGLVFDYNMLPSGALTAADFEFRVSPQGGFDATLLANQPAAWALAPPAPTSITNNPLSGTTRRIQLEWADGSIVDRWLRVTVKANANTGLAAPETFYLGHKAGEINGQITNLSGTQPFGRFTVTNIGDVNPVRAALSQTGLNADNANDVNKSGNINNIGDVAPVRAALSGQLTVIQIQGTPAPNFGGNGSIRNGRTNDIGFGSIFGNDIDLGSKVDDSVDSRTDSSRVVDDVFAGFESQLIGNSFAFDIEQDDFSIKKVKRTSGNNVSNDLVALSIGF